MPGDLIAKMKEIVRVRGHGISEEDVLGRLAENYRSHGWNDAWSSYSFAPSSLTSDADWRFLWYQWEHLDLAVLADMRPSGVPLIGRLLDALKRPLHQLVVHYVNMAVARVATAQMIQARLICALRADLARAEARLAEIEARQ